MEETGEPGRNRDLLQVTDNLYHKLSHNVFIDTSRHSGDWH